jgi:hypothetical protein
MVYVLRKWQMTENWKDSFQLSQIEVEQSPRHVSLKELEFDEIQKIPFLSTIGT